MEEGEGEGEGVEEGREQVRVLAGVTLTNPSLENGALTDIECSVSQETNSWSLIINCETYFLC